ncbi:uncharacterized protein BO72DRAFT_211932 [Aspergillus fijiensis CBS 313.89]|uniref:Uncharacterized protein n=1 Tax=Aspergillus fijiensis CBS 313.89 TaxID=1448319 RepID=A0A8G1RLH9_9EURO|nr:uncharacterized protein BO72DRAFT_211932 [Aspergillus fijiensis CBS 313.89]RAK74333.1 hypothetical protein BO72DRAFT_211932 [Aspergillus fijiensis CBS 313.89]
MKSEWKQLVQKFSQRVDVPLGLEGLVRRRDSDQCCLGGSMVDPSARGVSRAEPAWIIPPNIFHDGQLVPEVSSLVGRENCLLLTSGGTCLLDPGITLSTLGCLFNARQSIPTTNEALPYEPRRLNGIVDWEYAGYYPEYWEFTKAMYGIINHPELEKIHWDAFGRCVQRRAGGRKTMARISVWSVT